MVEVERDTKLEEKKALLVNIAKRLKVGGLVVNWSSINPDNDPALIIDGKCLLRPISVESGGVFSKFWYVEDLALKQKLRSLLGSDIDFANYCFDIGGPNIGTLVE